MTNTAEFKAKNIISLDIDGVLTDYPNCWLHFLEDAVGQKFNTIGDAKLSLGRKKYSEVKAVYRASDCKANLKIKSEARRFLDFFADRGFEFIIATSRPILDPTYPSLMALTKDWAHKNVQLNCNVFYKDLSLSCIPHLQDLNFHVDDELKYAAAYSKKNVPSFLLRNTQLPQLELSSDEKLPMKEVLSLGEIIDVFNGEMDG